MQIGVTDYSGLCTVYHKSSSIKHPSSWKAGIHAVYGLCCAAECAEAENVHAAVAVCVVSAAFADGVLHFY